MNSKIREQSVEKEVIQRGRFTLVYVKDIETGKEAAGVSRKSNLDRYNNTAAVQIAEGRALKALSLKKRNKYVNHIFMG